MQLLFIRTTVTILAKKVYSQVTGMKGNYCQLIQFSTSTGLLLISCLLTLYYMRIAPHHSGLLTNSLVMFNI